MSTLLAMIPGMTQTDYGPAPLWENVMFYVLMTVLFVLLALVVRIILTPADREE